MRWVKSVFVPWLEAQFKAIGLSPGNGDSYLQAVPMTEITNEILQPLSFKHKGVVTTLKPFEDFVLSSRDLAAQVKLADSELVFIGYGVDQASENWNDYKNVDVLRGLISDRGKIRPRRQTGTCARHQRQVAEAIKRARHMALLPFAGEMPR